MRALLIDPYTQTISAKKLEGNLESFRNDLGHEIWTVGRLPNGDVLLAGRNRLDREFFSLGLGRQVVGFGIIVGRKGKFGIRTDAKSAIETISPLIRFSSLADFQIETTPKETSSDIERFVGILGSEQPSYVPVLPIRDAQIGRCWENVAKMKHWRGGSCVYGWTIWERPRLFLTAEFHAVWMSDDGVAVDVTPKVDGEGGILFSPDRKYLASFDFLQRPANRRLRTYRRPSIDIPSLIGRFSPAQRAYEDRQALKKGLSLSAHLELKAGPDNLEEEIDGLFATCDAIDALIEIRLDGLHCSRPDLLAPLEERKAEQHQRILALAGKSLDQVRAGLQGSVNAYQE